MKEKIQELKALADARDRELFKKYGIPMEYWNQRKNILEKMELWVMKLSSWLTDGIRCSEVLEIKNGWLRIISKDINNEKAAKLGFFEYEGNLVRKVFDKKFEQQTKKTKKAA